MTAKQYKYYLQGHESYQFIRVDSGITIASFITQFYGLVIDILILGLKRATDIAGPPQIPNEFGTFESKSVRKASYTTIRSLCGHCAHSVPIDNEQSKDLIQRYLTECPIQITRML